MTCAIVAIIAAIAFGPSIVAAQTKPSASAAVSKQDRDASAHSIEGILASRGLVGKGLTGKGSTVEPPTGTEVDETVQTATHDGKTISRMRAWTEELNNNALHVEVTSFPTRQLQVAFWLLPNDSSGCSMFGRTMYDQSSAATIRILAQRPSTQDNRQRGFPAGPLS